MTKLHSVKVMFTHGIKGTIYGKEYFYRIFFIDTRRNSMKFDYYSEYLIEV